MSPPDTLMARIAARYPLADGIVGFDLVAADGAQLPAFTAGAHIDVHTPGGPVRPYSLWGPPAEGRYRIAVQLEPAGRGGSAAMHVQAQEGSLLCISRPRNHFPLMETAPRSLLLAGGIGITPLLAMAHRLHELGAGFTLHHATRTGGRAAVAQALRDSAFAERVLHHHDDQPDTALDIAQLLRDSSLIFGGCRCQASSPAFARYRTDLLAFRAERQSRITIFDQRGVDGAAAALPATHTPAGRSCRQCRARWPIARDREWRMR